VHHIDTVPKSPQSVQAALLASQSKPVKLRVAAALLHHEITGIDRPSGGPDDYRAALNTAAHALSQVSDLYYINPQGRLLRIPSEDVASGKFEGGAEVMKTASGTLYRSLSMRRVDVIEGIKILKHAHAAIHGASFSASKTGDAAAAPDADERAEKAADDPGKAG
jgi:hypothetical protein